MNVWNEFACQMSKIMSVWNESACQMSKIMSVWNESACQMSKIMSVWNESACQMSKIMNVWNEFACQMSKNISVWNDFAFRTQISYCKQEFYVVQCKCFADKVHFLCFCRSAGHRVGTRCFLFLHHVLSLKKRSGLHPNAPSKICRVRLTFARDVFFSLSLRKVDFPYSSFVAIQT